MLTEFVQERLAHLLAENGPRRARPADARTAPPAVEPSGDEEEAKEEGNVNQAPMTRGPRGDDLSALGRSYEPVGDVISDWDSPPPRRRSFTRAHVGVVCALLLIGLLGAGWSVLRARPVAIAQTPAVASSALPTGVGGSAPPSARPATAAASATPILVHVLGAVRKPGVVSLPERSRVREAIQAAGGLTDDAAPGQLNLAQALQDGQQVMVGTVKRPAGEVRDGSSTGGTAGGSSNRPGASSDVVDLNTATVTQLEELPGVGPVTAAKIVGWRTEHGRFSRVEELQEIDGIGPKTFAQIAPHARV